MFKSLLTSKRNVSNISSENRTLTSFYVYWLEREVAISPSLNLLATAKNNLFCYVFCLELNLGTIGKKWIRAPESLVLTVPFAEKA